MDNFDHGGNKKVVFRMVLKMVFPMDEKRCLVYFKHITTFSRLMANRFGGSFRKKVNTTTCRTSNTSNSENETRIAVFCRAS